MNGFFEQLKKVRDGVLLRSDRKAEIRENLVTFMRGHQAVVARPARARFLSWKPVFASVAILVLVGAGTTYASEQSLPGAPLYGMKLLKEEVQAALITDAEVRAEWEAERAERRLAEAAELAAAGKLDARLQAELEERFAGHAEKVGDRIRLLEEKDNFQAIAGLASRFEASLDAHNRILARLEAAEEVRTKQEVISLKEKVEKRLESVKGARVSAENRTQSAGTVTSTVATSTVSSSTVATSTTSSTTSTVATSTATSSPETPQAKVAAENKIEAALRVISEAERYLGRKGNGSEALLNDAKALIEEARAKILAGSHAEAFRIANEAIREAQETKILLRTESKLKLHLDLLDLDKDDDEEDGRNERGGRKNGRD